MGLLSCEKRELGFSKGRLDKFRKQGKIPAVVFGKQRSESLPVFVNWQDFNKLYHTDGKVFEMEIDGKKELVNAKTIDTNHLGAVTHISFHQLNRNEATSVLVPVHVVGESVGEKAGGIVQLTESQIRVKGLPHDIPEHIDVDITDLDIHHHITAGEVKLPKGLELAQAADHNVVVCSAPKQEVEEEPVVELVPEGEVAPEAAASPDESSDDEDKIAS